MVTAAEVRAGTHLILILKGSPSTVAWDAGFEAALMIAQAAPELVPKILAELQKLKPGPLPEEVERLGTDAMVKTWREATGG
jgi:hypothetical protein